MCGGMDAYEDMIRQGRSRLIAMSVFASGALPAKEALDYVCQFPQIEIDRVRRFEPAQHLPDEADDRPYVAIRRRLTTQPAQLAACLT